MTGARQSYIPVVVENVGLARDRRLANRCRCTATATE
jgi:hypothetical protein